MERDNVSNNLEDKRMPEIVFKFNAHEVDLDNIEFTPVNRGLGFHKDEIVNSALKGVRPRTMPAPVSLARPKSSIDMKREIPTVPLSSSLAQKSLNPLAHEMGLASNKLVKKVEANFQSQFGAWLIDISIISLFTSITGLVLLVVSGVRFSEIATVIGVGDLVIFGVSVFAIYYLTFFSIFDMVASPGKSFFKIKLVNLDGAQVDAKSSLVRAAVTLLSLILAGIPFIFDFQGKLSDTIVVEDKDA